MMEKSTKTHIAFLGPQGSHSHIATMKYGTQYFSHIIEHSCNKFSDVLKLITQNHVDYGILPIENSNSGLISEVCNLLLDTQLILVDEITIPIKHYILANNRHTKLNKLEIIYSHPQPIKQCSKFLQYFSMWKIILCESSAIAAKMVSKLKQPNIAALGSIQGGIFYGLYPLLPYNLSNHPKNRTRFFILKNKNKNTQSYSTSNKVIIIMSVIYPQQLEKLYSIFRILKMSKMKIIYLRSYQKKHSIPSENIIFLEILNKCNNIYTQQQQETIIKFQKIAKSFKIFNYHSNIPTHSTSID